jgi:DNA-binding NtrC family response regulator
MKPLKKANILLVEDEEFLIETFEASLTHAGYNVFAAKNPHDALKIVSENGQKIDMVITDVIMPKMSSNVLVEKIKDYLSDIKVIFMSGYNEELVSDRGIIIDEVKLL